MAEVNETVQRIIDRALEDPDFMRRFTLDPEGTARAEKIKLSPTDVKAVRAALGSEKKMAEALGARVSRGKPKRTFP